MASVLAIVSKSIFEKDARIAGQLMGEGQVFPTALYKSKNKALRVLNGNDSLFLVTVRPGGVLWLVAQLKSPAEVKDGWKAAANQTPILDISPLIGKIQFASGKGITVAPEKLGMSLQTPRALSDEDVILFQTQAEGKQAPNRAKATPAPRKQAKPASAVRNQVAQPVSSSTQAAQSDEANIERLLSVWRSTKAEELAIAIAMLSKARESKVARELREAKPKHKEWLVLCETINTLDRGALLASLQLDSAGRVKERIEAVAKWPADPRVVNVLHQIVNDLPWVSSGSRSTWTQVFKLLKKLGDPRSAKMARIFDTSSIKSSWAGPAEYMSSRLADVAKSIDAQAEPEPLSDADKEFAEQFRSLATPSVGTSCEALLEMVLNHPEDDEARLVLADAMQEQGDPRGTLIMLQYLRLDKPLTRDQKKREKEILKKHVDKLMGPMKAISLVRGREFERGFLSACELKEYAHDHLLAKAMGHPLLATITKLTAPIDFALQEELRSLVHLRVRHAHNESLDMLLRAKRELPFEVLDFNIWQVSAHLLDSVTCLPKLKKLVLSGINDVILRALQSDLAKQVDWVVLRSPPHKAFVEAVRSLSASKPNRVSAYFCEEPPGEWSCELILERTETNICKQILEVSPAGGAWQGSMARLFTSMKLAFTTIEGLQLSDTKVVLLKPVRDKDTLKSIRDLVPSSIEITNHRH